ncbi:MAG: response regulator transcription factor [Rhodothermales bacterium]
MLANVSTGSHSIRPSPSKSVRSTDPTSVDFSEVPKILVVDDDPEMRNALETYLQSEGYYVMSTGDGSTALELMSREPGFDLVLLDVVLPEMSGFEVLKLSQERGISSPVLMMSGHGSHENILRGFGLGAQDYIVKPFDAEDLVQRTRALLRPVQSEPLALFEIGKLHFDFSTNLVSREGKPIDFTEMEMDILRCLIRNRGLVVTKRRLLREAWRIDDDLISYTINPDVAIAQVDRYVQAIRRKIEANPTKPKHIETVYGLGYRFRE